MEIAAVIVLVGVAGIGGVGLWVWSMRRAAARYEANLRAAIREYVEGKGARIELHPDGSFTVTGPLGSGRERLTALRIMCKPEEPEKWGTTIGFVLRKYIPDAFDDAFARNARERLAKAGPAVEALAPDDLRGRLRVRLCGRRNPSEGLATCAMPLGERYEARVVVDGFDLDGIPNAARAKLAESDDALRDRALDATLGKSPIHAWLCRPEGLFGSEPCVIVGDGETLRWIPAVPRDAESELVALGHRAMAQGPMKGAMFAWDGERLHEATCVMHTVMGPTTPEFTIRLPASVAAAMGLSPAPDGSIGVRRAA